MNNIAADVRQDMIIRLKNFINATTNVDNPSEHIKNIFEMNFKYNDKKHIVNKLSQDITDVFKIDSFFLLDYIEIDGLLNYNDLGFANNAYKKTLETINNIKLKYGFMLRPLIAAFRTPFIINSVATNVASNNSLHTVTFSRADGEFIQGLFNPESLMVVMITLLSSLQLSIEKGIYNLNAQTIDTFLKHSESLTTLINSIYKKNESYVKLEDSMEIDRNDK